VIHLDAALGQQLLDMAIGHAVTQLPTDRHRDHAETDNQPGCTTRRST
jgi:hypothetical protein